MRDVARFIRRGLSLMPFSKEAREMFAKIPEGAVIFIEVWLPRNMAQHRKYFAILNNVVEAAGKWTSTEHLRRDILIALHLYDEHVDQFTGEIHKVPRSMAVASMPKAEFEQLYSDTIKLLAEALGADPELLTQEAA